MIRKHHLENVSGNAKDQDNLEKPAGRLCSNQRSSPQACPNTASSRDVQEGQDLLSHVKQL